MIANEKTFDDNLKRIGDLYEEGKDCLNGLSILEEERPTWSRCYEIIREMRDIAAVKAKRESDLLEALEAAKAHLEYIGYGDFYEREGTEGLREQIEEAIKKAKG